MIICENMISMLLNVEHSEYGEVLDAFRIE